LTENPCTGVKKYLALNEGIFRVEFGGLIDQILCLNLCGCGILGQNDTGENEAGAKCPIGWECLIPQGISIVKKKYFYLKYISLLCILPGVW